MIPFRLNDQEINVPSEWKDISYEQYLQTIDAGDDLIKIISILTGVAEDTLRVAEIKGLNTLLAAIDFVRHSASFNERPESIGNGKYPVPKDVSIENLAQFEDLRNLSRNWPIRPTTPKQLDNNLEVRAFEHNVVSFSKDLAHRYLFACAIYCQKIRDGKYNYQKAVEMINEIKTYSCAEVMPAGAFFMVISSPFQQFTKSASPKRTQQLKKKKRG